MGASSRDDSFLESCALSSATDKSITHGDGPKCGEGVMESFHYESKA